MTLCIRGILYITFIRIIWLPYQPCGMDWTAYFLFQTGNTNFIEFKGLAQCRIAGLSQGWIAGLPASVLSSCCYTVTTYPHHPYDTPCLLLQSHGTPRLKVHTSVHCGAKLWLAKPFQPASIAFFMSCSAQGICTNLFQKRVVCQKICFLKLHVPETPTAQIHMWFTTTPSIIIASQLNITGLYESTGIEDGGLERGIRT